MNKLMGYLPTYYRDITEFQELTRVGSDAHDEINRALDRILADGFISSSTEQAISKRENMFGILPEPADTLETRKNKLMSKARETPPYVLKHLVKMLDALVDEPMIDLNIEEFDLEVFLNTRAANDYDKVTELLERVVPLNMTLQTTVDLIDQSIETLIGGYDWEESYKICGQFKTENIDGAMKTIFLNMSMQVESGPLTYRICGAFTTGGE